jgi:hypothetical protein
VSEADVGIDAVDRKDPQSITDMAPTVSGSSAAGSKKGSAGSPARLEQDLDRLSLVQALSDTEAATARVIDLTERLVDARQQITSLRGELERMRIEYHQYRAEEETMKGSMAYRIASVIWNTRNAIRL